ncbi:MAG: DUF131 domain-containing protein [Candidatus Bathyarchaeia archaeon]
MEGKEQTETKWVKRFLMLFFTGFLIILLGMVLLMVSALLSETGTTSVGGVIFIWFFPIVFGAGPEAHWLVLFAIVLAVLGIIMLVVMQKMAEKSVFN